MIAVQWRGLIGGQGNAGTRPERRFKPGVDGGLRAASWTARSHHLRTAEILSKQWGPPHRKKLREKLTCEFNKPEGRVRREWVLRLIREYGFTSEQLDVEVAAGVGRSAESSAVFADIVAYRDEHRRQPFIVIETKRPGEKSGVKQAESYARNLGAEYHVWTDGPLTKYFRTAKYIDQSAEEGNIPRWVGDKPVSEKLPKTAVLPPFRDETLIFVQS